MHSLIQRIEGHFSAETLFFLTLFSTSKVFKKLDFIGKKRREKWENYILPALL